MLWVERIEYFDFGLDIKSTPAQPPITPALVITYQSLRAPHPQRAKGPLERDIAKVIQSYYLLCRDLI
jgi:hypothetical protein